MTEIVPVTPFDAFGRDWRFGVTADDRVFVVIGDIARDLGHRDAANAARMLDEDEKGTQIVSTPGGDQRVLVAYEDGIWELIFRSSKPEAKAIKKRVKEILAEIRRTGRYDSGAHPALPKSYADALRELAETVEERERLAGQVAVLAPAASSWNTFAEASGDYSVADAAKVLSRDRRIKTGRDRLFAFMAGKGWIYRGGDRRWHVKQTAIETGRLVESVGYRRDPDTNEKITTPAQVMVTPKGLGDLHRLLGGATPVAELLGDNVLQLPFAGA